MNQWQCARCRFVFEGTGEGALELIEAFGYGPDAKVCWECYCIATDDGAPPNDDSTSGTW